MALQLTQPNSPQLNTLGARVSGNPVPPGGALIGCMIPFLSISETLPVESQLEIFYESFTSGNFVDLNRLVVSDYGAYTSYAITSVVFLRYDAGMKM